MKESYDRKALYRVCKYFNNGNTTPSRLILDYNPDYQLLFDEAERVYDIHGPYEKKDENNKIKKYYSVEEVIEDPVKKKRLYIM